MMLVFLAFFLIPLVFVVDRRRFWDYNEYQLLPAFSGRGYTDTFEGCIAQLPDLCTIGKTYLKTLKLCFLVWAHHALHRLLGRLFPRFPCQVQDLADGAVAALHDPVLDLQRHPHDRVDSAARPQRPGQLRPASGPD